MTDSDDRIARRYREIAREEPPPAVDAAILAAAHRKTRDGPYLSDPEKSRVRPWFSRWAGPVSIAAVLVLGIGVSLRMQLEKPGIETSAPENEYSLPKDEDSSSKSMQSGVLADLPRAFELQKRDAIVEDKRKQNVPERQAEAKPAPAPAPAPAPLEERVKERRVDAVRSEETTVVTSPQAVAPPAPPAKEAFVPAPAPAAPAAPATPAGMAADTASTPVARAPSEIDLGARAAPEPPAAATGSVQRAPQAQLAAPRAKKEAGADAFAYRELNKSVAAPDAERDRELERIVKLREAGKQADADRALEAFRKRYPDFRIPEAMWERVRPR